MDEVWLVIQDFPNYSVSNQGRIRREPSGRVLEVYTNRYGVLCVGLMRGMVQHKRSVPLLVARTFIVNNRNSFTTPINLNGDRLDNRVENLVWRPRWFAIQYNRQFRDPYENPIHYEIRETESRRVFANSFDCAMEFGLLERDVVLSILNRTLTWPTYQRFEIVE